ncbi:hypothetical protein NA57DRAFT_71073 [Rhizodiscina lignyota]|uniref:DUF7719 domain-containing protein n=1 Tax=Rhizodiscina lignyota TaxID=1504668 RepID=A0A9P4INQ8_9PEZI|nr:hypothetical protein NA57DRAFT_71073 [Rhizodiscina lignyota]
MASTQQPKNRKERRAAERSGKSKDPDKIQTIDDIAMELPTRKRPDGKTLFELADERQAELDKDKPPEERRGPVRDKDGDWEFMSDEPLGAFGDAVLYGSSLSMLHFTLDVLVYNQYRQEIEWKEIAARWAVAVPILMLLVYMLHGTPSNRYLAIGKQVLFMGTSVVAGCYLVFSGNKHGYYAVMKRAPPVGTLWVWSVIEMQLGYAVPSLLAVGCYMWWHGLSAF